MLVQWMSLAVMTYFEVQPAVIREARPFLAALLWSTPPLLVYSAFRRYLQGMGLVKPVMFSLVSANIINAVFNWVLIYGHWGAPAMGAEGSGWSTSLARVYMAAVLVLYAIWRKTGFWRAGIRPDWLRIERLLRLGFPAAMQIVIEVGVFALATTLAGKLAPEYLVAHMIALQAASISFMVPLGLGSAGAVRVGQAVGRGDFHGARVSGWSAIALGTGVMGLAGVAFVAAPRWIGRLYTNDAKAIEAGVTLLGWAALFQLFDGAQGVATGVLRGAGNTRIAAITHFAGYWLIGLPVSWVLCFWAGWAASGLWAGLCLGIIVIGIVLVAAWAKRL
jgi:MATE family multidrug resistance protein